MKVEHVKLKKYIYYTNSQGNSYLVGRTFRFPICVGNTIPRGYKYLRIACLITTRHVHNNVDQWRKTPQDFDKVTLLL